MSLTATHMQRIRFHAHGRRRGQLTGAKLAVGMRKGRMGTIMPLAPPAKGTMKGCIGGMGCMGCMPGAACGYMAVDGGRFSWLWLR